MSDEERQSEGFKVSDRRSFTEDGELRQDRAQEPRPEPPPAKKTETPPNRTAPGPGQPKGGGRPQSGMDFSSFLLSLATTALVHLGEVADPAGGRGRTNIEAAKQMVEILAMLQEKSEGNRNPEEDRLLDDILYELRMKILTKTKAIQL